MNNNYADIRDRIAEPPRWWDEHAVPRYSEFGNLEVANIYADEIALVKITCQGCGRPFHVAFSTDCMEKFENGGRTLAALIREKGLHYGDPPNVGCCAAGPTMNSEPRRVLEYWRRKAAFDWVRDPALEVDITPDWVEPT